MLRWILAAIVGSILFLAASSGAAATLKTGDPAPGWAGLSGTDDKQHSLADYDQAKAIVMVFTCNTCPVAQAYQDRLIQLQKDYAGKGVQVVAVNVNHVAGDQLGKMKVRADEKHFNFPYLRDDSEKIGHDYGAEKTPHVFVLNKDRRVVYIGAIDDNITASKATKPYLRDALDAVLAGKTPDPAETPAVGCSVKYSPKTK
jgi:peroxiredoxin